MNDHEHPTAHLWPNTPNPGTDWMDRAKCGTTTITGDKDPYDPVGKSNTKAGQARYAANLCAGCPVIRHCAQQALYLKAEGMIRAGVCVPVRADEYRLLPAAIARLERIAGTEQVAEAA